MKSKMIIILSNVFLLLGFVITTIGPEAVHAGLIAYYDFEGDANDSSGNGYNGSVHEAVLTSAGYYGQAFSFDGSNDYISVNLNINPSIMPKLTMGAWVKAFSENPIRQVISHDNGGYDRSLGIDHRGNTSFPNPPYDTSGWSAFSDGSSVLGHFDVTLSEWTFVAAVYDQTQKDVMLYVNGMTMSEYADMQSGKTYLRIGSNPGYGEYFHGYIDEVFFFDEALSITQLNNIRANGVAPIPEPATILLLGSGLAGLAGLRRNVRKRRR
ncbi:MAG: LamG domain-containing protein [Deltaproteobacteria bacterium]|nr:LamG domain-containing protein [Deltaproteobacteria bacterium]